ncbi:hypothetical protein FD755_013509 [Muntiacus reevesi]|uniref:Uncharacterized protein n=1 Tax=Muntiacus reevesi TaxID=9886 RepID=A0A5N3XM70_MUNRE|nr:hypothetical protein FD755_013509 [Muntiacus reevesi]
MAESSSDSDHFRSRDRLSRWAAGSVHREVRHRPAVGVTEKVNTITSTLQLKESLEQSIGQLRSQRLSRNSGGRSISVTSLSTSDLDGGTVTESYRFQPTSPLKDYGDQQGIKRNKSRTGVRFVPDTDDVGQFHAFHQSLRDLSSEQVRLGDDFNRELVSDRVERRLQEIEKEMRTERELVERRQDQLGLISQQLQEVEELRTQLMKAEGDPKGLHHQVSQISRQQSSLQDEQGDDWRFRRGVEREDLEKQMSDLRVQLNFSAMASELEEVKRCLERKDKEKVHLAAQVECIGTKYILDFFRFMFKDNETVTFSLQSLCMFISLLIF